MKRTVTVSFGEIQRSLRLAQDSDQVAPWLDQYDWLVNHLVIADTGVTIDPDVSTFELYRDDETRR